MLRKFFSAKNCALRPLLLSEMLGLLATSLGQLAVAWWIAQSGGATDLSRYGAAMALCALLAMPLMSPLGDRWPKRRLIRLGKACLLLDALALAALAGSGVYNLSWLCLCSGLSILAHALLLPAQAAILPELVTAQRLPEAIRLRRGAQALGGLLGPGLGGAALALGGVGSTAVLNLLLCVLAALAAFRLNEPVFAARRAAAGPWFGEMAAGLRAKWGVPLDRWWTVVGALMMVFLLPMTGMLLPLRIQSLGLSPAWFGACGAALSLGLLLGVLGLADALITRLGRARAIAVAVLLCGGAAGAIGLCHWASGLALCCGLIGLGMAVTQLVGQTHRMLAIPEHFRARMSAAQLTAAHVAAALAPALAGVLLQRWPVATAYLLMATGFLASGLLLLAVPGLGHFLRLSHEEVHNWYGRQHPQAFAARPAQSPKSTTARKPT
ncbi:MFS transporter [Roseateles koreensis]|uniref:MFS transporter n=1 Tax=Roseateles koreensis TaxID=2987526 RepID=A0ABT5KUL3_9BURK|nr:MFS transporter [Roseateles koreensis]MDC8786125.1 MFS transporter [Roseateles koreensis]